jgi:hypothetical protein
MIASIAFLSLVQPLPLPKFDMVGDILEVDWKPVAGPVLSVSAPDGPYRRAKVRVIRTTKVVDANGKEARNLLRARNHIGIVFHGPVAESDPVQVTARRIVVLEERFDASGILERVPAGGPGQRPRWAVRSPKNRQILAIAAVEPTTAIYRVRFGRRVPGTARDLRPGLRIDLAYDGPVLMSFPPQGRAGVIVIR